MKSIKSMKNIMKILGLATALAVGGVTASSIAKTTPKTSYAVGTGERRQKCMRYLEQELDNLFRYVRSGQVGCAKAFMNPDPKYKNSDYEIYKSLRKAIVEWPAPIIRKNFWVDTEDGLYRVIEITSAGRDGLGRTEYFIQNSKGKVCTGEDEGAIPNEYRFAVVDSSMKWLDEARQIYKRRHGNMPKDNKDPLLEETYFGVFEKRTGFRNVSGGFTDLDQLKKLHETMEKARKNQ